MPESGKVGDQSCHPDGVVDPKGCGREAPTVPDVSSELSGELALSAAAESTPSRAGTLTALAFFVQSEVQAVEWFEPSDQSTDGGYFDEAFHEEGSRWLHPG